MSTKSSDRTPDAKPSKIYDLGLILAPILVAVGVWLVALQIPAEDYPNYPINTIFTYVVIGTIVFTSLLIWIDLKRNGVGNIKRTLWFIFSLVLWPLVYPIYFYKRSKTKRVVKFLFGLIIVSTFLMSSFLFYSSVEGVTEDRQIVLDACRQGDAERCDNLLAACSTDFDQSCHELGVIYRGDATEVEPDLGLALELFIKGCEDDHKLSCETLEEYDGACVSYVYVSDECSPVVSVLMNSCEGGFMFACNLLSDVHQGGILALGKDPLALAAKYRIMACEGKYKFACVYLDATLITICDKGTREECILALQFYETSCDNGFGKSCFASGNAYYVVEALRNEKARSFDYFAKGCENGHKDACANVAALYRKGEFVNQNEETALQFHIKACDLGSSRGCYFAGDYHKKGVGAEQNSAKAAEYFAKACEAPDVKWDYCKS